MRKFPAALLLPLLLTLNAKAQQNSQDSAWLKDNFTKKEIRIPMRDGIKLFTAVYLPKDLTEKHPILISRTPYSCAPYGENNFTPNLYTKHWRYYARENYIIVLQDVRGRYMSEGDFADIRPFNPNKKTNSDIDEASDTYDTIDWLIKNITGNNGNVGVFGVSYPGFYSTMAALCSHPALKAVSPQAPVTDWFRGDDWHHNGALMLMDAFSFYSWGFGLPHRQPSTANYSFNVSMTRNDNYQDYLHIGALRNFSKMLKDSMPFWNEMFAHPNYDDWWKTRNPANFVNDIQPAILTVGGLFDAEDCYGALNLYKAIEKKNPATHFNKLVMGPWYHGQWSSNDGTHLGKIDFGSNTAYWYQNNVEIPFFNYFLKGKGDLAKLSEATIFISGTNQWKQFSQWPPAGENDTPIYLQPGGKLSWNKSPAKNAFTEYTSDPTKPVPYTDGIHFSRTKEYMTDDQRFASRRQDVLTFQTDTLDNDLTLAGTLTANLFTAITTTDADFVVKLIDVFPDDIISPGDSYPMGGYQMLIRGDLMRGRFRNGFEKPEAFKPGKIEKVKFALNDVAHCFQKGHRILIQVQSSWFPLVDRNPQKFVNIYECNDSDFQKANIRIYHDAVNSSNIILPILKRD